jgi:hypothetical protein
MGHSIVVVVFTENQEFIEGFSSPIRMVTGTVHEVRKCNSREFENKLHWDTPTATIEVVALQKGGTQRNERTSVIYVDKTCKTPSHYEELQGRIDSTKVSAMVGGAYMTGQFRAGGAMNDTHLLQHYRLQSVMADEETAFTAGESEAEGDHEERDEREAFYSGESEGEEIIPTKEQDDSMRVEERDAPDDIEQEETETHTQAWDDMCQKVVASSAKAVRKVIAAWSKMDGTTKLVQIAVSYLMRKEAIKIGESGGSELVMVVGDEFWETEDSSQGQGAPGEETTNRLKTIRATGLRPTLTTKLETMVIRESQDESRITHQAKQFREKATMNKAVDGKKPRTHMPVISEKTAREGGYSAIVTSIEMMLLLVAREAGVKDIEGEASIIKMAAAAEELEAKYKGCYIAVKGKPNRELVLWRAGVIEDIRGAPTEAEELKEMQRLKACTGTTMEWLSTKINREEIRVGLGYERSGAEEEDVRHARNESVSTPSAKQEDKVENTKTMGEYNSPLLLKRKEMLQARKAIPFTATMVKGDNSTKVHRITPVMIAEDETQETNPEDGKEGTRNLFREYAEKAERRGDGLDGFDEHWQAEGANDDSEGEQYCKRNAEGEIVLIEEGSEEEGSGSQTEGSGSQTEGREDEESTEKVRKDKMETLTSLQTETTTGSTETTDSAECHQLKQRVGRLKKEVAELKAGARITEENQSATEQVTKGYKAKNAKLDKELKHNKETQLHLEAQMQKTESEKAQLEALYEKAEKALEEQKVELEKEMRGYVDEAAASGLEDCEALVAEMEELSRGFHTRIEDMEEQLQQAQTETRTLRENKEESSLHSPSDEASSTNDRIEELRSLVATQTALREAAESAKLKEGAAADAEIQNLLERLEESDREKQSQREKTRENQREYNTMDVEKENLASENESLKKELQTLREESSDKLRKKNEILSGKMDKLRESSETEQELMNKQKTDMKTEIKGLQEAIQKMEVEMQEQKTEQHAERKMREQELSEAEAEILTMTLSLKFEEDFEKLMKVLQQIGVSNSTHKRPEKEKPESQILNALEWYDSEALEAMCCQNHRLRTRVNLLTRICTRENRDDWEGDNWDITFQMVIGDKEMAAMSAEGLSRLRGHDAELEQARVETRNRISKNVHLIRQLQGNSCVVKNKTRGEVGTMLQQAEQEAMTAVSKQLANKNRQAVVKHTPSKMAELALLDSNKKMRLIEDVVTRQQKEQIAARLTAEARAANGGAEAEDGSEGPGSNKGKSVESKDPEECAKLEAMGREITRLETELETTRKDLALKMKEQAVAEHEGWIRTKLKFSEIAAQTKEEAERNTWNAEFSKELAETRTKLKDTEKNLVETENQLQKALISWNETTSKEKEKF